MPTYNVRINRATIEAATPEEAAQKSMTDPLEADDQFYVKEIPPGGSMFYVPGAAVALGGAFPLPEAIFEGPDFTPVQPTQAAVRQL